MTSWTAVVPVKAWSSAKSRLGVSGQLRAELAQALTLDTLDTLTSHPSLARVVVVTSDQEVAEQAGLRGATVLVEQAGSDPLNNAIAQGLAWIAEQGDGATVVVPADLAYLSVDVLAEALAVLAEIGKAHVPDLSGTGTTLLAAPHASEIEPHYGVGSSMLHGAAGFTRIDDVDPRVRADIDQLDDLANGWTAGPRVRAMLDAATSKDASPVGLRRPPRR